MKALLTTTIVVAVFVVGMYVVKANRSNISTVKAASGRPVTQATGDLISQGMTKEEVTNVFGRPPDLNSKSYVMMADDKVGRVCITMDTWTWKQDGKQISVLFGPNGKVFDRTFSDKTSTD
jgi:hypothetical protein